MAEVVEKIRDLFRTDNPHFPYATAGAVVALTVSGLLLHKVLSRKKKRPEVEAPAGTAVIYQFKRGPNAPSLSPFPVKLETFCRLAKIPYVVDTRGRMSSRGKVPWMKYNGEVVEDSQFCLDFFNAKLGIDLNKHLDVQQRAMARSVQVMVDEHLYWCIVYFRWVHDDEFFPKLVANFPGMRMNWLFFRLVRRMAKRQLHGQGIGRHSAEEIHTILMADLKALSDILGSKPFLFGSEMSEADCSAFGLLCQLVWHHQDPVLGGILQKNFPNLHEYCLRIKEKVWPDWEECIKN